jgi:hypothetical protein
VSSVFVTGDGDLADDILDRASNPAGHRTGSVESSRGHGADGAESWRGAEPQRNGAGSLEVA